ncbi:MAG: hypothetical protein JO122_02600 [Acetobacteraceae bacterium]|nr:hypothetical protein [Acetobacteraceae bacterium]
MTARPIDFRKGVDSLCTLVKQTLAVDPFICVGREYVVALRPQEATRRP